VHSTRYPRLGLASIEVFHVRGYFLTQLSRMGYLVSDLERSPKKMIRKMFKKVFGGSKSSEATSTEAPSDWKLGPHSVHQFADPSTVVLKRYRFSATIQPTTPLAYLKRHGEVADAVPDHEQGIENRFYVWLPEVDSEYAFLSKGRTISSSVGPIDPDGGDFLPFLIALRKIVERTLTSDLTDYKHAVTKVDDLLSLGGTSLAKASEYLQKLFGGSDEDLLSFVLREQGSPSYKGLSVQHLAQLSNQGFSSITDMINAPDAVLLDLKGIGPSRLKKIRSND
jgi:hypothetical protein